MTARPVAILDVFDLDALARAQDRTLAEADRDDLHYALRELVTWIDSLQIPDAYPPAVARALNKGEGSGFVLGDARALLDRLKLRKMAQDRQASALAAATAPRTP